jgi:hypothetical protein
MSKKIVVVILLVCVLTVGAKPPKRQRQPIWQIRSPWPIQCLGTASFEILKWFPADHDGDLWALYDFQCSAGNSTDCNCTIWTSLWKEDAQPGTWSVLYTHCNAKVYPCGSIINRTPIMESGINMFGSGSYIWDVEIMNGTCSNPGSVLTSGQLFFTVD